MESGDNAAAMARFTSLLAIDPHHAKALYCLGIILFDRQQFASSADFMDQALKAGISGPCRQDALLYLGSSKQALDRETEALAPLRKLLRLNPRHVAGLYGLGVTCHTLGMLVEAVDFLKQAHRLAPHDALVCNALGVVQFSQGLASEAEASYRQAIAANPANAEAYTNLGVALQSLGRFDEAMICHEEGIALMPTMTHIYWSCVQCKRISPDDAALVSRLENLARQDHLDSRSKANVLFSLGKCYDDLRQYELAFSHFNEANRLEHERQVFDRVAFAQAVTSRIELFSEDFFEKAPFFDIASASASTPIFIIGSPRSGTSLIDQIVSCHSCVGSVGEMGFPGLIETNAALALSEIELAAIARDYLAKLSGKAAGKKYVIDKMPHNSLQLGLIHLCFPSAPIICCRRDPIDTCLSMFFQKFARGHEYSYDLDDLAFYYEQHERLMAHWRRVIPDCILEVQYEDMVASQHAETRRILEFCHLDWEDACLAFPDNGRPVFTASNWQVRQALYNTACGRSRNYSRFLGPLTRLLASHSTGLPSPGAEHGRATGSEISIAKTIAAAPATIHKIEEESGNEVRCDRRATVRKATLSDIAPVFNLIQDASTCGFFSKLYLQRRYQTGLALQLFSIWLFGLIRLPCGTWFKATLHVICREGVFAGFAIMRFLPSGTSQEIYMCAIKPEFRGCGLGTRLIRTVLENIEGNKLIEAECLPNAVSMKRLLHRFGFESTSAGTEEKFRPAVEKFQYASGIHASEKRKLELVNG